jgi:hypothetical protein
MLEERLPFTLRMASVSSDDVRYEVRFKYWWAIAGMLSPRFAV